MEAGVEAEAEAERGYSSESVKGRTCPRELVALAQVLGDGVTDPVLAGTDGVSLLG